jgi:hypothetical protein
MFLKTTQAFLLQFRELSFSSFHRQYDVVSENKLADLVVSEFALPDQIIDQHFH